MFIPTQKMVCDHKQNLTSLLVFPILVNAKCQNCYVFVVK